ncbi:zona pellucida sperm-binding protein 3-like [Brachionichthys hirsutus]|uniref:zona pellucida sperm-binding protein 3-like n=1 Tax=Brachionichthys hirsutus TaxID=412623 RepID=UPI0036051293
MGRSRAAACCWWIIVLISLSSHAKCRLVYGQTKPHTPSRAGGDFQPPLTHERGQNAALSGRPRPVVVNCHPDSMEVVVQADMFDRGLRVDGRHLRLGLESASEGSPCRAAASAEVEFTIRADLVDCGTERSSTKETITYSNVLVYAPQPSSDGLLRLDGAETSIVCHYERRYRVNATSVRPTWDPSVSLASAEGQIDFNMKLMADNWQFKRGSYSYFLGDPVHLEVSAVVRSHMPLRVYVDRCVATATPVAQAPKSYSFIRNHGCFADAVLTNSSSRFLPRAEEHKLRFQLDAFRFYEESSDRVLVSCFLKAVPVILPVRPQDRACSLIENRWRSIDGNDPACETCDLSHRNDEHLSSEPPVAMSNPRAWLSIPPPETLPQIGPQQPATYDRFRPIVHQNQHNQFHQSSAGLVKRGVGRAIHLGPIIILRSDKRQADSTTAPKNGTG